MKTPSGPYCCRIRTISFYNFLLSVPLLVVIWTRLQLGSRAFCVAGSVAWNSLPLDIRTAPTLLTFKNMLKTHLFSRSYFTDKLFCRVWATNIVRRLVVTLSCYCAFIIVVLLLLLLFCLMMIMIIIIDWASYLNSKQNANLLQYENDGCHQ